MTVSVSPHLWSANTGFHAAITSIGTIPKSSSPGNMSHNEFCTKKTKSSPYRAPANFILSAFSAIFSRDSLYSHAQIMRRLTSGICVNAFMAISSFLNSVSVERII